MFSWKPMEMIGMPLDSMGKAMVVTLKCDREMALVAAGDTATAVLLDTAQTCTLLQGEGQVAAVALTPEFGLLAAAREEEFSAAGPASKRRGVVHVWQVPSMQEAWTAPSGPLLEFSRDGQVLVSLGPAGVQSWNGAKGTPLASVDWRGLKVRPHGIAVSPDGSSTAVAGPGVWLVSIAGEVRRLAAGDDVQDAHSVAFSPGGTLLAARCADGTIRLWDTGSGSEVRRWEFPAQFVRDPLAFTADGGLLVVASAGSIGGVHFWDLETGAEAGRLCAEYPQLAPTAGANRVAISAGAELVVFAYVRPQEVQLQAWQIEES